MGEREAGRLSCSYHGLCPSRDFSHRSVLAQFSLLRLAAAAASQQLLLNLASPSMRLQSVNGRLGAITKPLPNAIK